MPLKISECTSLWYWQAVSCDFVIVIIILLVTDSGNYTGIMAEACLQIREAEKPSFLIIKPWKTMII
jgi:ABC-type cobalt transport system substrate-binding protein